MHASMYEYLCVYTHTHTRARDQMIKMVVYASGALTCVHPGFEILAYAHRDSVSVPLPPFLLLASLHTRPHVCVCLYMLIWMYLHTHAHCVSRLLSPRAPKSTHGGAHRYRQTDACGAMHIEM